MYPFTVPMQSLMVMVMMRCGLFNLSKGFPRTDNAVFVERYMCPIVYNYGSVQPHQTNSTIPLNCKREIELTINVCLLNWPIHVGG